MSLFRRERSEQASAGQRSLFRRERSEKASTGKGSRGLRLLVRIVGAPLASCDDPGRADAIIVLGAALHPDGSLTPVLEERVRAGVAAWQSGLAPVLCLTGGRSPGASHDRSEAVAMAALARTLGVPDTAVVIEDASRSTFENSRHCAVLLLPKNLRRVWIVTQPFHLRRALRHFRRAGFVPLGYFIEESLQVRNPRWGLARVAREYVSWLLAVIRS